MPLTKSAPLIKSTFPSGVSFTPLSFTTVSPNEFGLYGERVAKTPVRLLPPSFGGLTVGVHSPRFSENPHISHRCENASISLIIFSSLKDSSKTISDLTDGARPLCLGTPNFSLYPFFIVATGVILNSFILSPTIKFITQNTFFVNYQ